MKVLWITNLLFPEALIKLKSPQIPPSGSWLLGLASVLESVPEIELYVASVSNLVKELTIIQGENITYYAIPFGKGNQKKNSEYDKYWKKIYTDCLPNIIHIHGTEYSHGLSYLNTCGNKNVVVSIQGLTSGISQYYTTGISFKDIIKNITLRDFLKGTIYKGAKDFERRGMYEKEIIKSVNHIIGRTKWDKAHVWAINPNLTYYTCNECLRPNFYTGKWNYSHCKHHTIFISQANYPIKGFHQVLKALPLVIRHYPDVEVRIAGANNIRNTTLYNKIRISGYRRYINNLITNNQLEKHIKFIGILNAEQMKEEYLSANVFVCPSSIENSPNSLGEAQILGVPCIVSAVGGTPDMIPNNNCGILYRFEEHEMLAYHICNIFESSKTFNNSIMIKEAEERHNKEKILSDLIGIYSHILSNNQ